MTKRQAWRIVIISTALVLALAFLVALSRPTGFPDWLPTWLRIFSNPNAPDSQAAAAILAFIAAAAVGIERVIETFWTVAGHAADNKRWPLGKLGKNFAKRVNDMNKKLKPFQKSVDEAITDAVSAGQEVSARLLDARKKVDEIKASISELRALGPYNPRARDAAAASSRLIGHLESQFPTLQNHAQNFNSVVGGLDNFIDSFKDNPARRLLSIYAGAFIGLLVAGILGLDLIEAILGDTPFGKKSWLLKTFPNLGTAFTGLVMGLGASPTHEVIRTLQEIKKERKTENKAL